MNKDIKHLIYEFLFGIAITFICLSIGALIIGIKIGNIAIIILSVIILILMILLLLFVIFTVPYGPYTNKKWNIFRKTNKKTKKENSSITENEDVTNE